MFIIIAHRTSGSVFGEATAVCKDGEGKYMRFVSREDAEIAADNYNALKTRNVHYHVEEEIC